MNRHWLLVGIVLVGLLGLVLWGASPGGRLAQRAPAAETEVSVGASETPEPSADVTESPDSMPDYSVGGGRLTPEAERIGKWCEEYGKNATLRRRPDGLYEIDQIVEPRYRTPIRGTRGMPSGVKPENVR